MKSLNKTALVFILALIVTTSSAQDKQYKQLSGLSMDKPRITGLSELEKANNALASVFGRTLPHPEQTVIVNDGLLYKGTTNHARFTVFTRK